MKYFLVSILASFLLSSCQSGTDGVAPQPPSASDGTNNQSSTTILSLWQSTTKTLDFRRLSLNQEMSADLMLTCTGNFGNAGKVNGMERGNVLLSGSTTSGYLMVGHLKYVGATDRACSDMSKELYSYKVEGDSLTFCALNWNACGTYVRVP